MSVFQGLSAGNIVHTAGGAVVVVVGGAVVLVVVLVEVDVVVGAAAGVVVGRAVVVVVGFCLRTSTVLTDRWVVVVVSGAGSHATVTTKPTVRATRVAADRRFMPRSIGGSPRRL